MPSYCENATLNTEKQKNPLLSSASKRRKLYLFIGPADKKD
jgi:hypothetical protein